MGSFLAELSFPWPLPVSSSSSSFSLISGHHEVSCFAPLHTPCHDVLPYQKQWTETMTQNKHFLKFYLRYFVTAMES
jgi:hypothetical protein